MVFIRCYLPNYTHCHVLGIRILPDCGLSSTNYDLPA